MIESIIALYLLIGFIISHYVWKEYKADDDPAKYSIPKWCWVVLVTGYCLLWPVAVVYWVFKR